MCGLFLASPLSATDDKQCPCWRPLPAERSNGAPGATLHRIVLDCGGRCSKSPSVGQLSGRGKGQLAAPPPWKDLG